MYFYCAFYTFYSISLLLKSLNFYICSFLILYTVCISYATYVVRKGRTRLCYEDYVCRICWLLKLQNSCKKHFANSANACKTWSTDHVATLYTSNAFLRFCKITTPKYKTTQNAVNMTSVKREHYRRSQCWKEFVAILWLRAFTSKYEYDATRFVTVFYG